MKKQTLFRILATLAGIAILNVASLLVYGSLEMMIFTKGEATIAFTIGFPLGLIILVATALFLILDNAIIPLLHFSVEDKRKAGENSGGK